MIDVDEARTAALLPVPATDTVRVDIIRNETDLVATGAEWRALWRQDAAADLFSTPEWFHNLFLHFGQAPNEASIAYGTEHGLTPIPGGPWSLRVCIARDRQGNAVAVLPLVWIDGSVFGARRRILSVPVNFHAPRSGLVAPRFDAQIATALADALMRCADWDVMILDGLSVADGRADLLASALAMRGAVSERQWQWPSASLRFEGSHESYLAGGARQHFRRSLVKSTNGITKLGAVAFERHCGHDAATTGFDLFLQVDAGSWKARSGESIAQVPALANYYRSLCHRLADGLGIEIWIMRVGDAPAAAFLCPHDGQVRYTLKSSFRESFAGANHSPSLVLLAEMVRHAWHDGSRGFDFVGKVAFLDRWSNEDLLLRQHVLFRRRSAWLRVRLVQRANLVFQRQIEWLRALKRAFRRRCSTPTAGIRPGD